MNINKSLCVKILGFLKGLICQYLLSAENILCLISQYRSHIYSFRQKSKKIIYICEQNKYFTASHHFDFCPETRRHYSINLCPLFSEQRGEQPRPEQDGARAREEDPGEHPPARPEAPHQRRPQHLELDTGEPCQIFTFTDIWQLTENDNAASIDFVWET